MKKLLIIGGVAAGMSAASKARRTNPDLDITVYTNEPYISYAGCGLPYFISNNVPMLEHLLARSVEQFAAQNITVKNYSQVSEIDPYTKTIHIDDLVAKNIYKDHYDRLIIATGARPYMPQFEGNNLSGIFVLRNIQDSLAIKDFLQKERPAQLVIIGAGYIGLEMVENLKQYDAHITLLERSSHIIPNMDEDLARILHKYLESQGVDIITGLNILGFEGKDKVSSIKTDQGDIKADFVLISAGVVPNSDLAGRAGVELGVREAIRVNEKMETNLPDIYAAGDCCTVTQLITGKETYIPMGTTANKQGKTAGENAAGGKACFKGVLGTGIARIMDMEIARTGLTEKECQAENIEYIVSGIKSKTAASYSPNAGDIYVKLLADKKTRQLLGGQILGYAGAAKRIDIIATAITLRSTIEQLIDMDLAYSPPFSPVWDPVLVALNQFPD